MACVVVGGFDVEVAVVCHIDEDVLEVVVVELVKNDVERVFELVLLEVRGPEVDALDVGCAV
jgi:hypothetical protein